MDTKHAGGRPTVMTDEVLRKLEEAFAFGASDTEAAFYADVSTTALYEYQKKNPRFTERKEALKERPILLARQTVVKALDDPLNAKWYLERKRKSEFAQRQEHDFTDNPIRMILEGYGLGDSFKEGEDDRKDDGAVQDAPEKQT